MTSIAFKNLLFTLLHLIQLISQGENRKSEKLINLSIPYSRKIVENRFERDEGKFKYVF